jgi:hypothetical protein
MPACAVINYLDFHDERNAGTAEWREGLKGGFLVGAGHLLSERIINKIYSCRFPFAKLTDNKLEKEWFKINSLYYQFWGRDNSAFIYALEKAMNGFLYNGSNPALVTKAVLLEIKKICSENKTGLIVTIMNSSDKTRDIKKFLTENNIKWIDISVDFSNTVYTNLPYDGHPSPLAHRLFAAKLLDNKMIEDLLSPLQSH